MKNKRPTPNMKSNIEGEGPTAPIYCFSERYYESKNKSFRRLF